jgi:hypothetical protein
MSIGATRLNTITGINQEQADADAETRKKNAEARRKAREAVADYRYDHMSDAEKREVMGKKIAGTQKELAGAKDDVTRGSLVERLVRERRELGSVNDRIKKRNEDVSEHRSEIEKIRASRSVQSLDTSQVFQHMYAVKAGLNPDEQVAKNTADIAENIKSIQELLKEAAG